MELLGHITPRKLTALLVISIIAFCLSRFFKRKIYDEKQLLYDLHNPSACANKAKFSGWLPGSSYRGHTKPCDVRGVDKNTYAAALARRASLDKTILLVMIDRGSLDITFNFYEVSLKEQNIQNYLFLSVDKTACSELNKHNIACYLYNQDRDASHDSVYYSKDFLRKMNYRTFMILDALELGYTILHSDVDMHFFKNPFNEIACDKLLCDMAVLRDCGYKGGPGSYNAGFVFMHPSQATIEVYKRMAWMAFHVKIDDQVQLNRAIKMVQDDYVKAPHYNLRVFFLEKESFLSGSVFWKDGEVSFAGDKTWPDPVVAHNNWIVSLIAKEYRFKEMLMWMYDKNQYFSHPDRKYLLYSNTLVFSTEEETQKQEILALRNAFAFANILNRTLILPYFHYNQKYKCNILRHLLLRTLYQEFPNVREHMFLLHPKVPPSVTTSLSKIYVVTNASRQNDHEKLQNTLTNTIITKKPKNKKGASSNEILDWFKDDKSSVLQFHSLYGAFYKYSDKDKNDAFKAKIKRAFKYTNNIQFGIEKKMDFLN